MTFEDRQYQEDTVDALLRDIDDYNPLVAVPTGAGKTVIMGKFIYKYLDRHPTKNILVVSHTQDILEQDHAALQNFFPGIEIGLYSAGLKSRTVKKITVAGIQSIYRRKHKVKFKDFDVVMIDEAHTIPPKKKSMYQQFLSYVNAKVAGMSATIFRRGQGYIYGNEDEIFNKLSHDLTSVKNFNKLIEDGYLSPLISKKTFLEMNTKGVKTTAGDFNAKALDEKFNREEITKKAVKEAIEFGQHNYKSWLIFAINIEHADRICELLNESGIKSRALHSKTNEFRAEIKEQFINQEFRALVSVGMITTGFDAPNVDLIILLRPTKSAVLHVQMIGRGLRICDWSGKTHCLILDFAGNTKRLGPVNDVLIPQKKGKGKKGVAPTKSCPDCMCIWPTVTKVCKTCGHEFKFKEKIQKNAGEEKILRETKIYHEDWLKVRGIEYKIHNKIGKPDSLKVMYHCGINRITEYVCLEHDKWAGTKAKNWVQHRWIGSDYQKPKTIIDLYNYQKLLKIPKKILVRSGSKFPDIKDVLF